MHRKRGISMTGPEVLFAITCACTATTFALAAYVVRTVRRREKAADVGPRHVSPIRPLADPPGAVPDMTVLGEARTRELAARRRREAEWLGDVDELGAPVYGQKMPRSVSVAPPPPPPPSGSANR